MITYQCVYRYCNSCRQCAQHRELKSLGLPSPWHGHGPYWQAFRHIRGRLVTYYVGKTRDAKSEEHINAVLEQKRAKLEERESA